MRYFIEDLCDCAADLFSLVAPLAAILVALVVVIGGFGVGMYALTDPPSCRAETRDMRHPSRWSFWGGCQVRTDRDGWIPIDNFVATSPARG